MALTFDRTTIYPDRDSWLAARRSALGGSDIAAVVLGHCDSYTTPTSVWESKVNPHVPETPTPSDLLAQDAGNIYEPALVQWAARRVGASEWRTSDNEIVRHPLYPRVPMAVSPDGFMRVDELGAGRVYGIECKRPVHFRPPPVPTLGDRPYVRTIRAGDYGDALWNPGGDNDGCTLGDEHKWQRYQAQCVATLACMPELDGMVLTIDARPFAHCYIIQRDADDIAEMERRCSEWWRRYVATREPPPVTEPDWKSHDLSLRLYETKDALVDLPDTAHALFEAYTAFKADASAAEAGKSAAKEKLRRLMAGAYMGRTSSGVVYSFDKTKSGQRNGQLRRKERKNK